VNPPAPLDALRRFARPRAAAAPLEKCELCGAAVAPGHEHLADREKGSLACACSPCAILFTDRSAARYVRVQPRAERLARFEASRAVWDALEVPIGLVFFRLTGAGVTAVFPGPAGPIESIVAPAAWEALAAANPVLRELEPDVEALLVDRLREPHEHWRVSIDECFALVGAIRRSWRGLSGGTAAQEELRAFFERLGRHAGPRA
jgi:hypothetical protein